MASKAVVFQQFNGGWATDYRLGVKGSAARIEGFDIRTSPSQISVLPAATLEDNNVISDLILGEVMTADGTIYATGDTGNVYRRAANTGKWSVIGHAGGAGGIDYRRDTDSVYITGTKTVSQIASVSATPILNPDIYGVSYSTYVDPTGTVPPTFQSGSANTTNILTAITESPTGTRYFQTDIEPVSKISVFITAKGTGNWTLTLEDGLDNILATATVTNANLRNNAFNDFVFTNATNGQVRLYPAPNARTYHIHVTSTVADGTISSQTINNMNTCDLQVWADRLVYPTNGLHPMERFLQYEIIGNANYISAWEPITFPPTNAEWVREQLTLPMEYECCGLAHTNEFLVAAFEKVSTNTTMSPQEGLLVFWDGLSNTYNYDVPITEGAPYGLHVYQNVAYYYAGDSLWAITSPTTQPVRLRRMPGTANSFSGANTPIKMYPQGMTTRRSVHMIGWPGQTQSVGTTFGVWSWGASDKNYPQALSYNYQISTGSQGWSNSNNLRIGMVKSFDDLMHISWQDTTSGGYGIDKVDNTTAPAATATWTSLAVDNNYLGKFKGGMYVEAYFAMLTGSTIRLSYMLNYSGTWIDDPNAYSLTNPWQGESGYARFDVSMNSVGAQGGRFRVIQMRITITSTGDSTGIVNGYSDSSPTVFMAAVVFDDKREEML
jgi:hypothetical protein